MAKKKAANKRSGNDTRGYATTSATNKAATKPIAEVASASVAANVALARSMSTPASLLDSKTSGNSSAYSTSSGFSASVYEILEELLVLIQQNKPKDPSNEASSAQSHLSSNTSHILLLSPPVLFKRVGTLHDTLIDYGFSHIQIRDAAAAGALSTTGSASNTLNDALDWLCLHIPTLELPYMFIEPWARDAITNSSSMFGNDSTDKQAGATESTLTVLNPPPAQAATTATNSNVATVSVDREVGTAFTRQENESSDRDDAEEATSKQQQAENKARLLERYQYEVEDEEEEDLFSSAAATVSPEPEQSHSTPVDAGFETIGDIDSNSQCKEETPNVDGFTSDAAVASAPNELRLVQMQAELVALEADANNEANNYMRSKHEIKALKQQVKNLRQQVQGWERKVQREQAAMRAEQQQQQQLATSGALQPSDVDQPESPKDVNDTGAAIDDDEDGGGMFSMFDQMDDESNGKRAQVVESLEQPSTSGICIPVDSIPPKWTGKTPRVYLEEWCRKEKVAKPNFQKLPGHGCRLQVVLPKNQRSSSRNSGGNVKSPASATITVEEVGPHDSYSDVQHYVATKVLYEINPTLPLYRLFPPFYRDVWLQWLDEKQTEKVNQESAEAEARRFLVDDIIQCIPKPTILHSSGHTSHLVDDTELDTVNGVHIPNSPPDETWSESIPSSPNSQLLPTAQPTDMGLRLQKDFARRQDSSKYKNMLVDRANLPIYSYRDHILDTIRQNSVTILCAETGSGKTTQCSSYILEQALLQGRGDATSILCTQPRRVAAISVAERVSDELGDLAIGKGLVGYQIRMEKRSGPETRLLFCTTGVILRRLIQDPTLRGISHVVVDEVHERQWQIDVLLVALRNLLGGARPDLKVVLMSATLDEKLFGTFFCGAPVVKVPGRTYPVATYYLEDLLEYTQHLVEEGSRYARRDYSRRETVSMFVTSRGGEKRRETADYQMNEDVSDDYPGYSLATRKSMDRVDEAVINYDLIEDVLTALLLQVPCPFKLPQESQSEDGDAKVLSNGAVLVFMPGLGEIRTLADRLAGSKSFGARDRFEVIPLHSTLSSAEQRRAFITSPKGCRKIIISTNVAETSVTIPDIVYVVDCGRVRELQRDKRTGTRKLVATWCSRASVKQRAGRAGRVQAGICLKLYSSRTESGVMRSSSEPELRRIPLEEVCLTILAGGFAQSCTRFLSQTPQPPDDNAVVSAVKVLEDIGALVTSQGSSSGESLTSLGRHLAKLPVDARVGKMLILGSVFKCTDSILTIAACLSASKSPFASSFDDNEQMKAAHAQFSYPFSDFLTFTTLWEAFKQADQVGSARKFCREKCLNYSTLREIQDARYQYLELLCGLGFIDRSKLADDPRKRSFDEVLLASSEYCRHSKLEQVVHSVVCAGLYPNVALLTWAGAHGEITVSHRTEKLFIQSSVNSKLSRPLPSNWVTFFEKFGTERRVSISKTAFVSPAVLMLFASNFQVVHTERVVLVDNWIQLNAAAKTAVMFRVIRDGLNNLLTRLLQDFDSDAKEGSRDLTVIDTIVKLIVKG